MLKLLAVMFLAAEVAHQVSVIRKHILAISLGCLKALLKLKSWIGEGVI